jgi:hypothetical protein
MRSCRSPALSLALAALALAASAGAGRAEEARPTGKESAPTTRVLEGAAGVLQNDEPIDQIKMYLVGFHPMKSDPSHQMEAHHYCNQVNEEFAQCVLFDGNTSNANLNGIEYIISERLFETLSLEEKRYWHPHNYEILSGQLVAPGIPAAAEKALMAGKMNSYGKTWHVWKTGMFGQAGDKLPLGEPHLAWSFNRDGEDKPGLVAARDKKLGVDTAKMREERRDLAAQARPQCGVDAIQTGLPGGKDLPGVRKRAENCPTSGADAP